ncbi:hypothetical protein MA16_Dca027644 [Dendrobium catenatum]|uniref:Uncharacterized protein n=1 Tax=Dendrobium catenatum TaxID=906689 RepID=A0A2I0W3G9_9ASPA|nr:hypothetical protein MA16_Dca027644 [Dendrobium catenatum]
MYLTFIPSIIRALSSNKFSPFKIITYQNYVNLKSVHPNRIFLSHKSYLVSNSQTACQDLARFNSLMPNSFQLLILSRFTESGFTGFKDANKQNQQCSITNRRRWLTSTAELRGARLLVKGLRANKELAARNTR